jgi:hypothetical protein
MKRRTRALKRMYLKRSKLVTEEQFIRAHRHFFFLLSMANKIMPSLLERGIEKNIKKDIALLQTAKKTPS